MNFDELATTRVIQLRDHGFSQGLHQLIEAVLTGSFELIEFSVSVAGNTDRVFVENRVQKAFFVFEVTL